MFDDLASERELAYAMRLMDQRAVTRRTIREVIRLLEDCPVLGDTGLDTTWLRPERPTPKQDEYKGDTP